MLYIQGIINTVMKILTVFFNDYKKETILAPLFKLLEALMDLIVPLIIANIINDGVLNNDKNIIIKYFFYLIGLAVLGLLFSFTAQWFAAKASVGFSCDLRKALFDKAESLSYKQLDNISTDTLITRMTSDVNQIQNGLNLSLRLLLRSPFIVFGSMIMAFTIDVKLALIFLISIPILSIVVFGIMYITIPLYEKSQKKLDELLSAARENLNGVRVLRAFRKEDDEINNFNSLNNSLTSNNIYVGKYSSLMNPLTYVTVNIAIVVLIYQGALKVELGILRQGDVLALYNYMAQIIIELIKLASLVITINKSLACADRVEEILEIDPDMKYQESIQNNNGNKVIEFKDVCFSYNDETVETLSDINFDLDKNKTLGIIGGTGSGKSSLGQLILRNYDVNKGDVLIDGENVKNYSRKDLINKIGIVEQKDVLFEGTIRENMKLGNDNASDEEIYEALRIAQALEVVENKENGLDSLVEQNGRNFSGGQRQRLCIARALVKKPEILILDDSSSALDLITDKNLRTEINKIENMSVVIISQRTSSIMNADKILVLNDGKLVGVGIHEDLLDKCDVYKEIYYSQHPDEAKGNLYE